MPLRALAAAAPSELYSQRINRVDRKLDSWLCTMALIMALFSGVCLVVTTVRIENDRNAAVTESVPSAESLRPVNGKVSGPRWHCALILTRET